MNKAESLRKLCTTTQRIYEQETTNWIAYFLGESVRYSISHKITISRLKQKKERKWKENGGLLPVAASKYRTVHLETRREIPQEKETSCLPFNFTSLSRTAPYNLTGKRNFPKILEIPRSCVSSSGEEDGRRTMTTFPGARLMPAKRFSTHVYVRRLSYPSLWNIAPFLGICCAGRIKIRRFKV